jgi:hypothetical protein
MNWGRGEEKSCDMKTRIKTGRSQREFRLNRQEHDPAYWTDS